MLKHFNFKFLDFQNFLEFDNKIFELKLNITYLKQIKNTQHFLMISNTVSDMFIS